MKKIVIITVLPIVSVLMLAGCSNATGGGGKEEKIALTAYSLFLSGDTTLMDEEQLETWCIPDFQDESMEYEYSCLDLDGDDVVELLVQMADEPGSYNAVFHFEEDKILCWNSDAAEMSCWDYPLSDGTMVRQYNYNGTRSYTIFRYLPNGETEDVASLFAREERIPEDSSEPCPYYEIDGKEVDKTVFDEQLSELVTEQILERSEWRKV